MRIACYHNLPSGGAKRVLVEHCRGLREAVHEVVVYEPTTAESDFCDMLKVASRVVRVPFTWKSLPPSSGPLGIPLSLLNAAFLYPSYRRLSAMQARLAEEIDAAGYDLLYVHHDRYETAPTLLRYARTPTVYFCQEPARRVFEAPLVEGRQRAERPVSAGSLWWRAVLGKPLVDQHVRYRQLNEQINTRAATMVLANSSYSCESILRAHGRVARRCTLGVDTGLFSPDPEGRERAPYVLSVGAFYVQKGFRFLIRALAEAPAERRPRLVLAGDRARAEEVTALQELAAQLGVDLTVHVRLTDELLCDLYRRARLFLYAPYLEPLGLTALEAMACGTPVLGVREGGVRETVVEGVSGRLAEHEEKLFAEALVEMLGDVEALQAMGRTAREYVCEKWTWGKSVEHLLSHFAEVLGQPSSGVVSKPSTGPVTPDATPVGGTSDRSSAGGPPPRG